MGNVGRQSRSPSWFDPEKYSLTDNLECWKWARLLSRRHYIKSLLELRDRQSDGNGNNWDVEIENEFRFLIEHLEICSSGEGFEVEAPPPDGVVHFPTRRVSAVEALTVGGAGFLWGVIKQNEIDARVSIGYSS
jgi:hypothetical protein